MSAVPLADLKTHLDITTSGHDAELQNMLDAAETHLAHYVGPLGTETVTDEIHSGGLSRLMLNRMPVASITSAEYTDGTEITLEDLDLDAGSGIVYWGYNTAGLFTAGTRNVKVTYEVGRASLPDDLRLAVLILAADMWTTQRGNTPPALSFSTDDGTQAFNPNGFPLLPPRVEQLIAPYRAGSTVA